MFADSARVNFWAFNPPKIEENYYLDPPKPWPYPTFHFRHRGVANVLWCDGRVTAQQPQQKGYMGFDEIGQAFLDNEFFDRK